MCPIFFLLSQVWFQNRRMKDKRQKMTLAWPCGDPIIAAYVLQAAAAASGAAGLPYPAGLFGHNPFFGAGGVAGGAGAPRPPFPPVSGPPVPQPPPPPPPGLMPCRPMPLAQSFDSAHLSPPPPASASAQQPKSSDESTTSPPSTEEKARYSPSGSSSEIQIAEDEEDSKAGIMTTAEKLHCANNKGGSLFQPYLDIEKK